MKASLLKIWRSFTGFLPLYSFKMVWKHWTIFFPLVLFFSTIGATGTKIYTDFFLPASSTGSIRCPGFTRHADLTTVGETATSDYVLAKVAENEDFPQYNFDNITKIRSEISFSTNINTYLVSITFTTKNQTIAQPLLDFILEETVVRAPTVLGGSGLQDCFIENHASPITISYTAPALIFFGSVLGGVIVGLFVITIYEEKKEKEPIWR